MNKTDPRFYESLELFNRGRFFESHEVLEKLWLETKAEPENDLYKGIIQAAAALFLLERGPQTGAWELCKNAVRLLGRYRPRALGLDVEKLVKELGACFGDFRAWDGKRKILVDASRLPRLEWERPAA